MHKAGFVNIVGNPNVGKSTLMNALVGERISIATFKAQTTRHRIMGIYNTDEMQIVFSDTPGVLKPNYKLQESMLNFSTSALTDADILLYVTDVVETPDKNNEFMAKVRQMTVPVLLLINKIDLTDQEKLVKLVEEKQISCLFIGHDLALVRSVSQRIAVMYLGRIVEKKMTELGNSLMHGDISIKPYEYEGRKPCEYCEFKNICAYEDGVDQVEKIKKVSLEEGKHALDQTTAESH